jgi:hypothetical protein
MSYRSRIGIILALVVALGVVGTSCSVVGKVRQDVHNIEGNKATIDSFTQNLNSNKSTPFEATYTTTGSSPATVVYAVDPSSGGLAFHETQTGADASTGADRPAPGRARSSGRPTPPPRTRSSTSTPRRTGSPS